MLPTLAPGRDLWSRLMLAFSSHLCSKLRTIDGKEKRLLRWAAGSIHLLLTLRVFYGLTEVSIRTHPDAIYPLQPHTHKSRWVRPTECVCTSLGMQRCPQWCRGSAAVLPCFKGAEDLYLMRSEQTGARGWSQIESWRRGLTNTTIVIT